MTSKAAWHIELRENSVREWVQEHTLKVVHVASKTNLADVFTKEMRDGIHFCWLRDSFVSTLLDFPYELVLAVHHACSLLPGLWLLLWLVFLSPVPTPPLWEFSLLLPSSGLLSTSAICQVLANISFGVFVALFLLLWFSSLPWFSLKLAKTLTVWQF